MATLYREYRPQNFKELVGQNHIKITLEHEIALDKIAHAYLFCGPRGIGKTTVARVFSKAINCPKRKKGEYEPCNQCDICGEINNGRNLDIIEVDAASHTGVDNVRENIIANARVAPSRCKFKVFIIDEVHMLSISAFNALLKIVEEPPAFVIFILCTTEIHKVPTTIISRCQRFDFKRIAVPNIVKKLNYIIKTENIKINKQTIEAIAMQSEGHMRDAESLLGQIIAIGGKEITQEEADLVIPRNDLAEVVNLMDYLAKKNCAGGVRLINKLVDEGVNLKTFLSDLIKILRKTMLFKINPALTQKFGLELGENMEMKVNQVSQDLTVDQLINYIEKFIKAKNELKGSFIIQLPIEMAIIELCAISSAQNFIAPSKDSPAASANPSPTQAPNTQQVRQFKERLSDSQPSTSPTPANMAKTINKELILTKWNEVLAKVKKYNHSLSFILRACQLRGINDQKLCLAFKYKFHKERVEDGNIKRLIEKALHEVYGSQLIIEPIIDENLDVGNGQSASAIPPVQCPSDIPSLASITARDENLTGTESENSTIVSQEAKNAIEKEKSSENKKDGQNGKMIDNLLNTFGGKVVE